MLLKFFLNGIKKLRACQRSFISSRRGQILAELLIAIGLMAILAALGAQLVNVSFQSAENSKERENSLRLAQEALEAVRAISQGNYDISQGWNRIYLPPNGTGDPVTSKGSANSYYPVISTSTPAQWVLFTGIEQVDLDGEIYSRQIIIDNISRDAGGLIESAYNPSNDDPATQKITVTISKSQAPDTTIVEYVTRFFNDSGPQSDWSGSTDCSTAFAATSSPNVKCSVTSGLTTPAGSFKLQ